MLWLFVVVGVGYRGRGGERVDRTGNRLERAPQNGSAVLPGEEKQTAYTYSTVLQ